MDYNPFLIAMWYTDRYKYRAALIASPSGQQPTREVSAGKGDHVDLHTFKTSCSFVASIILPFVLSLPVMNAFCPLVYEILHQLLNEHHDDKHTPSPSPGPATSRRTG